MRACHVWTIVAGAVSTSAIDLWCGKAYKAEYVGSMDFIDKPEYVC
jgi:hypothetical protein